MLPLVAKINDQVMISLFRMGLYFSNKDEKYFIYFIHNFLDFTSKI